MGGIAADAAQLGVAALEDLVAEGGAHVGAAFEERAGKLQREGGGNESSAGRGRRRGAAELCFAAFYTPCKWRCAARWKPAWAPSLIGWSAGSKGGLETPSSSVGCGRDQSTAGSADRKGIMGNWPDCSTISGGPVISVFDMKNCSFELYLESHDEDTECIQDSQTHFSGDVSLQQWLVQHVRVRVNVGWREI